ncbi:MAG: hypothetical protein CMH61_01085 [Nanoarchaeota archaeon]|nr:hypothetical protein [Nanoarchaeota archaeon]|tara:strand:+ start:1688 stop:2464 length:777 start_codon:yes stop_codon:yes gene_type:complete
MHLTIDCEEWNSPHIRGIQDKDNFNTEYSRLGNERLLKIFNHHDIKCTFFVTGFYAEKEPENVKEIIEHGHEVASHGYEHHYRNRVFDIEADVKKSKRILEKITKNKVIGFRAPQVQFSMKLLQILKKLNFKYDSSLHPAFLPGYYPYKNITLPLHIHEPLPGLKEVPIATLPNTRFPIVWLFQRNLGNWYTQLGVNGLERKKINPVIYMHSWEFAKIKSKHVPFYFTRRTGLKFCKQIDKFIKKNNRFGFGRVKDNI